MAGNVLEILITGKDQFSPKARQAQRSAGGLKRGMASLGKTVVGVGAGFIAAQASIMGVQKLFSSTIGAAMKFEAQLAQIRALTGATTKDTDFLSGAIKDLSKELGKPVAELAAGAYFILSSGIEDAAEAAEVLEVAAKASAIGLGETERVADALTTVINAYGLSAGDAARVTDVMIEAVKQGKAEASAFAGVLGRVVPLAAEMGITFEEVAANLATFTRLGVSAEEAATGLRAVMISLKKPTTEAEETLADIGTSAKEVREQIREKGLLSVLADLMERFKGNEEALVGVFGNIRALTSVLGTAGGQMEDYRNILAATENATGNLEEGLAIVSDTAQFKMKVAIAELNIVMLELGEVALPIITIAARVLTVEIAALSAVVQALRGDTDALGDILESRGDSMDDLGKSFLGTEIAAVQLHKGIDAIARGLGILGPGISGTAARSQELSKQLGDTGVAAQDTETRLEQLGMKAVAAGLDAADFGAINVVAADDVRTLAGATDTLKASLDALIGAQQENIAILSDLAGVRTQEQVALEQQINALALEQNAAQMAEVGQSNLGGATESTTDAIQKQVGALQNLAISMVPQALNNEIIALERELKVLQLGKLEIEAQINARNRLAQAQLAMANVANLPALAKQKKLELDRAKILATVGGNVDDLTNAQKKQIASIDDQIQALQSSINVRTLEAELTNIQAEASDKNREAMQRELNEIIDQIGATQDLKGQRELYIQTLVPVELLQDISALERQRTALGNSETGARNAGGALRSLSSIIGDQIGTLQLQRKRIDLVTEGWKLQGEAMLGLPTIQDVTKGFASFQKMILMGLQASLFEALSKGQFALVNQIAFQMAKIGTISFREHGGPVSAGQAVMVGEKRPEIFVPDRAGTILPDARASLGGGGGDTVNIFAIDVSELADALMPYIRRAVA